MDADWSKIRVEMLPVDGTTTYRPPVYVHGARPTRTLSATEFGPCQLRTLAQRPQQRRVAGHVQPHLTIIDFENHGLRTRTSECVSSYLHDALCRLPKRWLTLLDWTEPLQINSSRGDSKQTGRSSGKERGPRGVQSNRSATQKRTPRFRGAFVEGFEKRVSASSSSFQSSWSSS